jgi:HNH endonuclease
MMKHIPLRQGLFAIVDDKDYDWLNQWKWSIKNSRGILYATRSTGSRGEQITIWMHRLIMKSPQEMEVDHVNGNGLDNRRENLRIVTRAENLRNRKTFKNSKSGFKGVVFNPVNGKWRVTINLGTFDTPEKAARVYDEAVKKLFGALGKTNFDDPSWTRHNTH